MGLNLIIPILLLLLQASSSNSLNSDGLALLALKSAITTDPTQTLRTWSPSHSNPCRWIGVTCLKNRVTQLSLPSLNLTGYIPSELGLLNSLKRLVLTNNSFSKSIPPRLFNATGLTYVDFSSNFLTGPVPIGIESLTGLTHLDLSSNRLNGSLPEGLANLTSLTGIVNLSYNEFSGRIPASYGRFPVKCSLDVGHNKLVGEIPQIGSLLNQGPTAFAGNPGLCGFPLRNRCPEAVDASANSSSSPENPLSVWNPKLPIAADEGVAPPEQIRTGVVVTIAVPIISGVSIIVAAVSILVWIFNKKQRRRRRSREIEGIIGKPATNKEEMSYVTPDDEGQNGKFVVLDEGFNLELEDLLRATAFMIGKSKGGIVYKVVCGVGAQVAVRRLSENESVWKFKEFVAEVEAIGRVQHPNLLRLRAYYYANDEKLLVSDYVNNGSLHTALHGGPSCPLPTLSWSSRLTIAQGIARGLMHIHEKSPHRYVHGNLKSSKILLGGDLHAFISGFGLTRLISGTSKLTPLKQQNLNHSILKGLKVPGASNVYSAPEIRFSGTKFTQKCDIYSFGIILLEILTGKMPDAGLENDEEELETFVRKVFREKRPMSEIIDPSLLHEVYAKKQVIAAFHIALNCTEVDPEVRPRMRYVSESLDRISLQ